VNQKKKRRMMKDVIRDERMMKEMIKNEEYEMSDER
jgi:hypothetical protein